MTDEAPEATECPEMTAETGHGPLTTRQDKAVEALLQEPGVTRAAAAIGVSRYDFDRKGVVSASDLVFAAQQRRQESSNIHRPFPSIGLCFHPVCSRSTALYSRDSAFRLSAD